ncbi:FAD dependent oxidoreductase superfamily [Fusarium albosuccineum]|uniref:FAD dependent oxidoreductase superfamily n=1 Tax=Fusarium albosuccineum TaxID=1237068 RepID=A0A8H4P3R1_9HYPO|nr:FAD dependent oxidoreductase superfamily [Fusarium albosuccineum]
MSHVGFIHDAVKLITIRPGLPSAKPTVPTWQQPPHPTISNAQSPVLPKESDVIIIGSGITGIAVAHCLLNHSKAKNLRVTMLEARTAVSGATGRNGGHLVSDSDSLFPALVKAVGLEQAIETVRFSEANIRRLRNLVTQLEPEDREAVEFRDVITTTAFEDQESFEEAEDAVNQLGKAIPNGDLKYKVSGKRDASTIFGYRDVAGVVEQHGVAALWPYRLLTAVLASLKRDFPGRFNLETNTPVKAIDHQQDMSRAYPYILHTSRGALVAKQVVHCTNGYSGHLIPNLVGKLYPLRGTMSTQKMGPSFPRVGDRMSWAHISKGTYNFETGHIHLGLYYAQQNAKTGVMFLGGESQKLSTLLTSDDSTVAKEAQETLCSAAPCIWKDVASTEPLDVWSGIMGFTADGMPLVGKLPTSLSGRSGDAEWIAAGFNGHGMDKCWLSGETIARMVLGEEAISGFPRAYLLSAQRVEAWTPEKAAETLMDHTMLSSTPPTSHL